MKMTMYTAPTMVPRAQVKERRPGRPASGKRLALARNYTGKARSMARRSLDPCDNSNDSGLGFDHHMDPHTIGMTDRLNWSDERAHAKRPKLDIKFENDEVNENYSFPEHAQAYRDSTVLIRTAPSVSLSSLNVSTGQSTTGGRAVPRCVPIVNRTISSAPASLTTQLETSSRYSDITLSILCQPEQQHRARYQTEGSRGAVKDRSGNSFPIVQLTGYNKPSTLQVFIGTDLGKVAPHMFYQACRVSGKNSTPCQEKKIDGTIVIELQLDPTKEMMATCDCVGILKERNVDVEHRFPDQLASRSKKKSTRCRMIFRTMITHDDGAQETLQVCSQAIVCTQPPGIPEISKKSLTSCPAGGGLELFIIGKNFLKDTLVYFQSEDDMRVRWEQSVVPDKEFLQQTHLVCVVPPYLHPDITEPVTVRLYVMSSGKTSEAHQFVYTPVNGAMPSVHMEQQQPAPFLTKMLWNTMTKQEQDVGMMPPPGTSLVPLSQRRSSTNMISTEVHSPPMRTLKQELMDENSQNSVLDPSELRQGRFRHISESSLDVHQGDSNMSMINDNSIDMMRHSHMMHSNMNENSNLSLVNESSMDMMRRNMCENSLGEDPRNFSAPTMNVMTQNAIDELKVIDLRTKMPMATVADLVNTNAPSMATLQSFGVTESTTMPLLAQSAQSIENYLTDIELKNQNPQVMQTPSGILASNSQPVLSHLGGNPSLQHDSPFIGLQSNSSSELKKTESAPLNEQTTLAAAVAVAAAAPISTERLDALINCAVDIHISPRKNDQVMMGAQDVILNAPLTPIALQTPGVLSNPQQSSPTISPEVILNTQISPSLMCRNSAPETLLPPTALSNLCHPSQNVVESGLLQTNQLLTTAAATTLTATEPEKAILLDAAVDLFETQKKLNNMQVETTSLISIMTTTNSDLNQQLSNTGNTFLQYTTAPSGLQSTMIASKSIAADNKRDFLNVPMKGVPPPTGKAEDRMIPTSFANMSENDLINIINPSCFDQGTSRILTPLNKMEKCKKPNAELCFQWIPC